MRRGTSDPASVRFQGGSGGEAMIEPPSVLLLKSLLCFRNLTEVSSYALQSLFVVMKAAGTCPVQAYSAWAEIATVF